MDIPERKNKKPDNKTTDENSVNDRGTGHVCPAAIAAAAGALL